jgi:hypothetical protein
MEPARTIAEHIQTLTTAIIATHPTGHRLFLIGGFRYRLLDASARTSADIDYHWEGDLQRKQSEIIDLLRNRLVPEVKRQFGYDGDVRPATGPDAESPAVRIVETAFYRREQPGSRIEVPIEITSIVRLDPPIVRTKAGTVFLTVSDADMIESKVLALLNRRFVRVRDALDLFLFQDALRTDAPQRLSLKLKEVNLPLAEAAERLEKLQANRVVHVREMDRLLAEQVSPTVAANLRAAGGGVMIWDSVMRLLGDIFAKAVEVSS